MKKNKKNVNSVSVESLIRIIRGERVILDNDLAMLYGVETKALNRAVKRNTDRFPTDFVFQLSKQAADSLRCQIGTLETGRGRYRKYLPYAFTEHGAIMAAIVLNSPEAIQTSVFVVRAFVRMRSILSEHRSLARQLSDLEKELKGRLDLHETAIVEVLQRVMEILDPPPQPEPKRRRIGFHAAVNDTE